MLIVKELRGMKTHCFYDALMKQGACRSTGQGRFTILAAFEVEKHIQTTDCSGALKYSSAGFGVEGKSFS
jgi:hypothetical protein